MTTTQTDREQLAALCLSYLKPPKHPGASWTLNPEALADAIIADGWRKGDVGLGDLKSLLAQVRDIASWRCDRQLAQAANLIDAVVTSLPDGER